MDTKAQARTNIHIQELKRLDDELEDVRIQIDFYTINLRSSIFSGPNSRANRLRKDNIISLETYQKLLIKKKNRLLSNISESTS